MSAPLRLLMNPFSSSARRVTFLVAHLGLDVELDLLADLRNPVDRARLTALNPNAKIPVLVHGDFVLWESMAIMQYLADLTPGQTVYPTAPAARADVNRWLFWGTQHWLPPIGVLTWERWMKGLFGAGDPDAAAIARAERELAQLTPVLDAHLGDGDGREWLVGDALTIADIGLAIPLMRAEEAALPLADHPHVAAWLARVKALPAWAATA